MKFFLIHNVDFIWIYKIDLKKKQNINHQTLSFHFRDQNELYFLIFCANSKSSIMNRFKDDFKMISNLKTKKRT